MTTHTNDVLEAISEEAVEKYILKLVFSPPPTYWSSEDVRTIVAGNIRTFAAQLREDIRLSKPRASNTPAERRDVSECTTPAVGSASNCDRCPRVNCNDVYHSDGSCMSNKEVRRGCKPSPPVVCSASGIARSCSTCGENLYAGPCPPDCREPSWNHWIEKPNTEISTAGR